MRYLHHLDWCLSLSLRHYKIILASEYMLGTLIDRAIKGAVIETAHPTWEVGTF